MTAHFRKRLWKLWRLYLAEPYATGGSIAILVGLAVLVSVRFDLKWLSSLAIAVLDLKPVLLFLLGWCAVRFLQLSSRALFPTGRRNFRIANRLRNALADGSLIYVSAAWGAVLGLWLTEQGKRYSLVGLMISLLLLAVVYPFLLAFGVFSNRSPGLSRNCVRWLKLGACVVLLVWLLVANA